MLLFENYIMMNGKDCQLTNIKVFLLPSLVKCGLKWCMYSWRTLCTLHLTTVWHHSVILWLWSSATWDKVAPGSSELLQSSLFLKKCDVKRVTWSHDPCFSSSNKLKTAMTVLILLLVLLPSAAKWRLSRLPFACAASSSRNTTKSFSSCWKKHI